jgi:hypothetical protein
MAIPDSLIQRIQEFIGLRIDDKSAGFSHRKHEECPGGFRGVFVFGAVHFGHPGGSAKLAGYILPKDPQEFVIIDETGPGNQSQLFPTQRQDEVPGVTGLFQPAFIFEKRAYLGEISLPGVCSGNEMEIVAHVSSLSW